MNRFTVLALGLVLALVSAPGLAEDLTGANQLLCSAGVVVVCADDGLCDRLAPADLRIPQFVEVDLVKKRLSTTKASGENRTTDIASLQRNEGRIILQGLQKGRAFSFVIDEESGAITAAVAADGLTVTVFGSCTPTPPPR